MNLIEKLFPRRRLAVVPRDPAGDRYPTGLPLPLLAELVMLIREVTEEDIERAARGMTDPAHGEKVVGRVMANEVLQLWALHFKLSGRSAGCKHRAAFESPTPGEAEQAKIEAERWIDLARVAGVIFWIAAKDDVGEEAWSADANGKTLDVRKGWRVVAFERKNPMSEFMSQLGGPQ